MIASRAMLQPVLRLILAAPVSDPHPSLPANLRDLFAELRALPLSEVDAARDLQDQIHYWWSDHPDATAVVALQTAEHALSEARAEDAGTIFERLTLRFPYWAEAWHKLAVTAFMRGDHAQALDAIAHALRIEPRHYNAMTGFADIAAQAGDPTSAAAAYEIALEINPHLSGSRAALEDLNARLRPARLN